MITTMIVFPAILDGYQFFTQLVQLGGIFPNIYIENVKPKTGLHHFNIQKHLPHYGESMIASAVAESELQMEFFWNVLAYVGDFNIRGTGQVFYLQNGKLVEFNPKTPASRVAGAGLFQPEWFEQEAPRFHKKYDYDMLKRFTFSKAIKEPIGKFLSLYSLVSSLCGDRQPDIDKLFESVDATIAKSLSPWTGRPETIFTRLRNELAHHRDGTSAVETHRSIEVHLQRFEWIVKVIVGQRIEIR